MGDAPDFDRVVQGGPRLRVVADKLMECLQKRGLAPQADGEDNWQTGLPGLSLKQGETMVAVVGPGRHFAHVEITASLDHPTYGKHTIADLVSLNGETAEGVLAECVEVYMRMTFDPLRALFDAALFADPAARLVGVTDPGEATAWNVYAWGFDVRGPDHPIVLQRLEELNMLSLVGSTLAGYLAEPRLHWCKLFGESSGDKRRFGCIFDGHHERDGVAEMPARLNLPPGPASWNYRGFMILLPYGEPDAEVANRMQAEMVADRPRRAWWQIGAPKRRVWWEVV